MIEHEWGREDIWANNQKYNGRMLHFIQDKSTQMHFHREKDETIFIISGKFLIRYINVENGEVIEKVLEPGDSWNTPSLLPHQFYCMEKGVICEVSNDAPNDVYNISVI
jgi:D-lyxose ketol-isomerase